MAGISTDEAIAYGLKHMATMGMIYLIGFAVMAVSILFIERNLVVAGACILAGLAIILGGLHGAIYKMAGDATAKVLEDATVATDDPEETSSTTVSSASTETDTQPDDSNHPDPSLGNS